MGCWIMAGITFREAARKKILWTALIAGLSFLALFGIALHFQMESLQVHGTAPFIRYQILSAMLMVGLYVVDLLMVVMSILISVDTIPGEISSGTIHAIATKPVPRWHIFLGKWLGFTGMIAAFIAFTFGGTILLSSTIAGVLPEHAVRGAILVFLECLVTLSATFLFGTWVSTLTSGVIVIGLCGIAFMGGWIEQMSGFTESARLVSVGIATSLIMPSEAIWRRAAFEMQTPLAGSLPFSPFANVSIPSPTMIGYAGFYLFLALLIAIYHFQVRDL